MKYNLLLLALAAVQLNAQLRTPLERSDYSALSRNSEILEFTGEAARLSSLIRVERLTLSAEGKEIPLLKISKGEFGKNEEKIKVLVFAQQHGNEHSGKEGALLFIKEIASGKLDYLFDRIDLLLIPQLNPDGSDKDKRENGNGSDLNRNHLILTEPEVTALHDLFNLYMPEATLDIHEYTPYSKAWMSRGYRKNFDEQVGCLTNPNISPELRKYQREKYLPYIKEHFRSHGFSSHEYIVGTPAEGDRIRFSTTDINDGRQSFGIMNTFSFIIEGINGKTSIDNIKRRAEGQYSAIRGFMNFIYENTSEIKNLVMEGRQQLVNGKSEEIAVQMEHVGSTPYNLTLLSTSTGRDTTIELMNYHTIVEPRKTVRMPLGYLVSRKDSNLVGLLIKHNIILREYKRETSHRIKHYLIKSRSKEVLEDLELMLPKVEKSDMEEITEKDYYFIPQNQIRSRLLTTMLEPESMASLCQYEKYSYLVKENEIYPVLRVEEN